MTNGELSRGKVTTQDIVGRLWGLCNVLRDDGVTYQDYVTELTFLLFLKMMQETEREDRLPAAYRWAEIAKREGIDQLDHYKRALLDLGRAPDPTVQAIFTDAQTKIRKPANLKTLTTAIDGLDWFSAREEGLGELYEGLLEKNAAEKKSGAGQYFTPRPLIDCIVRLMKPKAGETVQDPAAGTGGFLVAADHFIKEATDDLYALPQAGAFFQRNGAYTGIELVPETHRLALMNLMLHGIESPVTLGDSLSPDGEALGKADLILASPPRPAPPAAFWTASTNRSSPRRSGASWSPRIRPTSPPTSSLTASALSAPARRRYLGGEDSRRPYDRRRGGRHWLAGWGQARMGDHATGAILSKR